MKQPRGIVLALACLAGVVGTVRAQSVGVFFDPEGMVCSGPVSRQPPYTELYIVAFLAGPASDGIAGVELRVDGLPADWIANVGECGWWHSAENPFRGGASLAWPTCQTASPVTVCRAAILPAGADLQDVQLTVRAKAIPTNPELQCPFFARCDAPSYTPVCVAGGTAVLNPTGPGCSVGVEPSTWTRVRTLYRD